MGALIESRRAQTGQRIRDLENGLGQAAKRAGDRACVYITGSFARGEATNHSDLDLFIVGTHTGANERALPRLDEICIKAELIEATRRFRIPDFSGDGQYLTHYTVHDLVDKLGKPEDDASNTFTARLLLLLESRPLIGRAVYSSAIDSVVAAYWRDFEKHKNDFIPAFLSNDILRLWRTLCINYEARTSAEPEEKRAKRWVKNYKLKHSRLLTCYSAVLFLLAVHVSSNTVTPDDATAMVSLTPTERLQGISDRCPQFATQIDAILSRYEMFLSQTDMPEAALVARILDPKLKREYSSGVNELGNGVAELLLNLGHGTEFLRHLLV